MYLILPEKGLLRKQYLYNCRENSFKSKGNPHMMKNMLAIKKLRSDYLVFKLKVWIYLPIEIVTKICHPNVCS